MATFPKVRNYEEAVEFLSKGRNHDNRPLVSNTRLERRDADTIAVRLYETDIVTFHSDGKITLNSGGWRTITTKDRINSFNPAYVSTDNGRWFILGTKTYPGETYVSRDWENPLSLFYDGMQVNEDGTPVKPVVLSKETLKAEKAKLRQINRYIDGFIKALREGMETPSGGDCWFCLMKNEEGVTLGDLTKDNDHLEAHFKDKYYVPSLLFNALIEKGYPNPAYITGYSAETEELGGMRSGWGGESPRAHEGSIRIALRSYLKRRVLPNYTGSTPADKPKRPSAFGYMGARG